jgi:uncharacterized membrane protein (UPF0182 family)
MGEFRERPSGNGEDDGLGPPPSIFQIRRREFHVPGGLFRWAAVIVSLIVIYSIASVAKDIYVDWLWFESVDQEDVYRTRISTQLWLFFAGAGIALLFLGANVLLALWFAPSDAADFPFPGLTDGDGTRRAIQVIGVAAIVFIAVIFGAQAAGRWDTILLFLNSRAFGVDDPQFNRDIGFYVFRLPALNFFAGWSIALGVLSIIVVTAIYAGRALIDRIQPDLPFRATVHVSLLLVGALCLVVWRYYLSTFALVYAETGATFGAGWTAVHANLPVIYLLMTLATLTALVILANLFLRRGPLLPAAFVAVWVVAAIAGGIIYPATVQRFQVEPNELAKEREYIKRNIQATRAAYGLDRIEERDFLARESVTEQELSANPETLQNIRLWDHRPLLQTLDQLQTLRPLHNFLAVDVDRYEIDGQGRQVMLAARELDVERLPEDARSWVNRRLQFTHGYGVAMVPVNEVVEEGLPSFFIKDMPPEGEIEIDQPRIYFGEGPEHYVIVGTRYDEFDYPIGADERAQNRFDGGGGVTLDSFLRRAAHAWEFADLNLLISDAMDEESRLLYRRNVRQRVEEIAPFLRLDHDPYLVVADGKLVWMIDAYTHSDLYPYSTRSDGLNYIRNSVKATIDAYDGRVTFYLVDDADPVAQVYADVYPDLFTPFDEMPDELREHVRYPEGLFRIQADLYRNYHITNPDVFFNREDVWAIPTEVFQSIEQAVEPYYVIMRLPGEAQEEFVLILPFRLANKNNTISWMAARSDGEQYGKMLTFRFPTDSLVFGPSQVEARIDQDTQISAQISLWNQSGSQVIRGNLLMIPIGEGNLFVEPIYLQATQSELPELKRVVVVNGNDIAMEPTLERALQVVLGRAAPTIPTAGEPGLTEEPEVTPIPGTPRPTSTPAPTDDLPDDTDALIAEANASFQRAQQLLQQGDFAGYGEEVERLQEILQQLSELSGS